jgi:hypothetical protein
MFSFAFINVCPIQFHFLRFTVVFIGSCFVLFHNSMLLILSGQCIFSIVLNNNNLFMKDCNFCVVSLSTLQVSAPYSNTYAFNCAVKHLDFYVYRDYICSPYTAQLIERLLCVTYPC